MCCCTCTLNIEYLHKIFVNFLRGILAFQKNDKSFARDLYQSNLSDKTRKTYNQINIILTHCQVNKIKNVTVCYSILLLKKTKKMIKLNGIGEKGVLTRKIDIKSLIINLQR